MSLLHQEELDDAAKGEELTRGTSHVIIAFVVAFVLVSALIAWYVIGNQKPPAVTGEVVGAWAVPRHMQTAAFDAAGQPMPVEESDQILVFAQVRMHNQSQQQVALTNIVVNATLDDGIHTSYAATSGKYDQIFLAYPDLTVPHGKALLLGSEIDPGQNEEGSFVSAFKVSKQQWESRKDLNLTISFRYLPNLVLEVKQLTSQ